MDGYQNGVGFLLIFVIVLACYLLWEPPEND
jgi:hypothetical protein